LLKLKKLQILGFKSFCDRTDLRFQGEGIAAIVGPNGCGKSNISDAISWVLGEQSARLLRGVNMQDVIFAGTRDRKPTGMAEVSLTLVDPEVYGDVAEPEIDIQDEMSDDWDESALRAANADNAERYSEQVRPGQTDDDAPPMRLRPYLRPTQPTRRRPNHPLTPLHKLLRCRSSSRFAAANSSVPSRPERSRSRVAFSVPAKANIC
jgi:chromosome segregation protein